jgi:drug/metabolite transporter (DMT)-like permease
MGGDSRQRGIREFAIILRRSREGGPEAFRPPPFQPEPQPSPSRSPSPPPHNGSTVTMLDMFSAAYVLVALNVASAVGVILVNKFLLRVWPFALALTLAHSLVTKTATLVLRAGGIFEATALPTMAVGKVALCGIMSVVLMNLSLSLNPIGIYQASKILVLPMTAILELIVYGTAQSNDVWAALVIVMAGVALSFPPAVVSSLAETASSITWPGLAVAAAAVIVAAGAVLLIGRTQKDLQTTPLNLLDQQQLYVIGYMLSVTFTLEGTQPFTPERLSSPVLGLIAATACMAAILNVSGFYVIRVLSPLTYQVTSHLKTIATLILGALFFEESLSPRQVLGFALSIVGIAVYTYVKEKEKQRAAAAGAQHLEGTEIHHSIFSHHTLHRIYVSEFWQRKRGKLSALLVAGMVLLGAYALWIRGQQDGEIFDTGTLFSARLHLRGGNNTLR